MPETWHTLAFPPIHPMLARVLLSLVAVGILRFAARVATDAVRRGLARTRAGASVQLLVSRVVQIGFLAVAVMWVLSIFGVQLSVVVTVLGVTGVAVSLATQDVLKNLVAGVYILVERPFSIGDRIQFRTYSGVVEDIQLRTTALRTTTGERVVIPNAMLFVEALVNRSAYKSRLVKLRVVLPAALAAGDVANGGDGPTGAGGANGGDRVGAEAAAGAASPDRAHQPAALPVPLWQERRYADQLLAALRAAGTAATGVPPGPPRVLVESLTRKKITLRAEVWAADTRTAAVPVAWAVRSFLPHAKIVVLE